MNDKYQIEDRQSYIRVVPVSTYKTRDQIGFTDLVTEVCIIREIFTNNLSSSLV